MTENKWTTGIAKLILPKLGELLFVSIFIAVVGLGPRLLNMDGDLGRHITIGNYILSTGTIPINDRFSFTKYGDPVTPHEWLAQLIFALANRFIGLDGVVLVVALVIGLAFWLVYKNSLMLSKMNVIALIGTFLAAAASSLHWLARPHIFTILFSAVWIWELERIRLGKSNLWFIFPLLMLFWVNLHGAFLAGFAIWICYFFGSVDYSIKPWKLDRIILFSGLSSALVTLVNPVGIGIWKTSLGFLGNRYLVGHTAEYLPPNFQNVSFLPFLILILISVIVLLTSQKRICISHNLLIGGWTFAALISARNIPLYAVCVVPVLILYSSNSLMKLKSGFMNRLLGFQENVINIERKLKSGFWAVTTVLLAAFLLYRDVDLDFAQMGNVFLPDKFPVEAVNWLQKNQLEGDGFNYFPWGGYLLYRNWPEKKVFIDGQTDFYGEELTREYEKVITLSGNWQGVFDEYQVQWLLMPVDSDLVEHLRMNSSWNEVYKDGTSSILERD
jgi:hypothetical protein